MLLMLFFCFVLLFATQYFALSCCASFQAFLRLLYGWFLASRVPFSQQNTLWLLWHRILWFSCDWYTAVFHESSESFLLDFLVCLCMILFHWILLLLWLSQHDFPISCVHLFCLVFYGGGCVWFYRCLKSSFAVLLWLLCSEPHEFRYVFFSYVQFYDWYGIKCCVFTYSSITC